MFLCMIYKYLPSHYHTGCDRNFNGGRAAGTTRVKFPRGQTSYSKHGRNGGESGSNVIFTMRYGTVCIRSFKFLGQRGRHNQDTFTGAITINKKVRIFALSTNKIS